MDLWVGWKHLQKRTKISVSLLSSFLQTHLTYLDKAVNILVTSIMDLTRSAHPQQDSQADDDGSGSRMRPTAEDEERVHPAFGSSSSTGIDLTQNYGLDDSSSDSNGCPC